MKLITSFVPTRRDSASMVAVALAASALVLVAAALLMAIAAYGLHAKSTELMTRLTALQSGSQGSAQPAQRAMQDLASVRDRVRLVNGMVGLHGTSTLSLLEIFERLLPDTAYVVSLQHRAESGEVVLLVTADSATPLTAFLRALEREPQFQQVLLLRQSSAAAKHTGGVQFEIRLKERA